MAEIEFILNGKKTIINCKKEDIMIDIINRFVSENGTFLDSVYFIYNGQQISNFLLSFNELAKSIDKEANKMSILVQEKEIMNNNYLIKSKEIIYPKCHKSCRIKFDNYKIKLYDCANLHIIDNIFLEQFEKCQNINEMNPRLYVIYVRDLKVKLIINNFINVLFVIKIFVLYAKINMILNIY